MIGKSIIIAIALATLALTGCVTAQSDNHAVANYPEASPFDENANAQTDFANAHASARAESANGEEKLILAVFGANWCHDSRALAGWLETPRFKALTDEHFEVVYIDVGVPQAGKGRNLDLAENLGLSDITGTPTLMVLTADTELLNADTAKSWRNTSTRSEDEIFAELEAFTQH